MEQQLNFTQRELEVSRLLVDGLNNREIAKKLSISSHTVKVHLCAIYEKLSVNNRVQAVVKILKMNVL